MGVPPGYALRAYPGGTQKKHLLPLVKGVFFVNDYDIIIVSGALARYPHVYTLRVVQCGSCKGIPP